MFDIGSDITEKVSVVLALEIWTSSLELSGWMEISLYFLQRLLVQLTHMAVARVSHQWETKLVWVATFSNTHFDKHVLLRSIK